MQSFRKVTELISITNADTIAKESSCKYGFKSAQEKKEDISTK